MIQQDLRFTSAASIAEGDQYSGQEVDGDDDHGPWQIPTMMNYDATMTYDDKSKIQDQSVSMKPSMFKDFGPLID